MDTEVEKPARRAGRPVLGVVLSLIGGVAWLTLVEMGAFIVPKFVEVFEEFGVAGELPTATVVVLAVAHALLVWWPVAAMLWIAVVGGLVTLCVRVRKGWPVAVAAVFAGVSLVGVATAAVLIMVTLFVPLVKVVESVG